MNQKIQSGANGNSVDCTTFDAHLSDLMDGVIQGETLALYRAHADSCSVCGPLYTLAQEGRQWMSRLDEVEPPIRLVHNILARTSLVEAAKARPVVKKSWLRRISDAISPELAPTMFRALQPRVAMTFAAAFFSISLGLNMAGIRVADLKRMVTDPESITTTASLKYHETTSRVVKYYENIRIVVEFEAITQKLRGTSTDEKKPEDKKPDDKQQDNNTSEKDKQNRNYRLDHDADVLSAVHPASRQSLFDDSILS